MRVPVCAVIVAGVVMETNVKKWYCSAYPTDEEGSGIDPDATFAGAFRCLDNYGDIYLYLGASDSIVRERVFWRLSEFMGVEYGYIYDQWMKCHTHTPEYDKSGNFTGYFVEDGVRRIALADIEAMYNNFNL